MTKKGKLGDEPILQLTAAGLLTVDPDEAASVVMADETEALRRRLDVAEKVCLLFGWSGRDDSITGKAAQELYNQWTDLVNQEQSGFTHRASHPELSDGVIRRLAGVRDEKIKGTLRAIDELKKAIDELKKKSV